METAQCQVNSVQLKLGYFGGIQVLLKKYKQSPRSDRRKKCKVTSQTAWRISPELILRKGGVIASCPVSSRGQLEAPKEPPSPTGTSWIMPIWLVWGWASQTRWVCWEQGLGRLPLQLRDHMCRECWCLLSGRAECFAANGIEGYECITFCISMEFIDVSF